MQSFNDNEPRQSSTTGASQQEETGPQLNLRDILYRCIANWYWFIACMLLTATVAQYYLMSTNNVYTRTASLLVKDSKSSVTEAAEFSDLSVFNTNTNIENEIVILRSPALMREVVERLSLQHTYNIKDNLRTVELYKNSPVTVVPVDSVVPNTFSFTIEIESPTTFVLSHFKTSQADDDDDDDAESMEVTAGKVVSTPIGVFKIEANPNVDDYIGRTIRFARRSPDAVAASYVARLSTSKDKGQGSIINLSISDQSIQKADDILNCLIQVYNERWIQDKNQIALSTSKFIDERLGIIESELGNVESDISSFKSANLLPDVDAVSSMYLSQSAANNQAVVDLTNQKSIAQYIRNELNGKKALAEPLPLSSSLSNAQVSGMIDQYNTGVIERNRLVEASSIDNPVVKDMTKSLTVLRDNIIESVDNYISTLNTQIRSYERQERVATGKLAANPNQAKYLLSVERQQKVKESLYLYLLQKREENELSQAFTAYNTRIVNPPGGSSAPTSPNRGMIFMVSLLLGFAIPAGVIAALETMNTRIRGRKDIDAMTVPFVGEVPLALDPKKGKVGRRRPLDTESSPIVIRKGGTDVINEAMRVLRSSMEFMFPDQHEGRGTTIAVTSINPGSGKSFITANLAAVFAIKEKKTIIMDLDLRRATLSKRLGYNSNGITNYLSGKESDWKTLIIKGEDDKPDILPAGPIPPNPSELLYSKRLNDLFDQLRAEYDIIFIDCPPVEVVADAYIINRYADLTLFIVRAGLLERSMIPEIERLYTSGKLRNMGLILNGTSVYKGYHRYGYSYSYNYGYSYSHDYTEKQ